jgi:hypothetical protein
MPAMKRSSLAALAALSGSAVLALTVGCPVVAPADVFVRVADEECRDACAFDFGPFPVSGDLEHRFPLLNAGDRHAFLAIFLDGFSAPFRIDPPVPFEAPPDSEQAILVRVAQRPGVSTATLQVSWEPESGDGGAITLALSAGE